MKNKLEKILLIFILIQPLLDVDAAIETNSITFNMIIRSLFFISALIYIFIKKKFSVYNIVLGLGFILYFINYILGDYSIISYFSNLMKLFYLPVSIEFFMCIKNSFINDKTFIYIIFLYLIIFLLSYITGLGYDIYIETDGKSGFKGLFNSVNEFSAIISCLYPICLKYFVDKKNIIISILLSIFMFLCCMLTGTKILLGTLFLSLFIVFIPYIGKWFKKLSLKKKVISIISSLIIIISLCYGFTFTRTYKNMKIQADFFETNNILSYKFFNKVIYNDRLSFVEKNNNEYINSNIRSKVFGDDYSKLAEIDLFDITYLYGIIGLVIIIFTFIYVFKTVKLRGIYLYSFLLLILISLTSGHVLFYPAVSIYFGLILFNNNFKEKKE